MNTYTLTSETIDNLKIGDILFRKNETNSWEVCGISSDAFLHLREVVSGEKQYLFSQDFYGWIVTAKERTPDLFNSGISLNKARQYLLKAQEQKTYISQVKAQLAKEKAEAEEYAVAFFRDHYEEMVAKE
ncbi:MAG: hypothetical protein ACO3YZ_03500 [Candidatus Nanopelagicaceae bacterium]